MPDDSQANFTQSCLSHGTRLNGIYEIDHPIGTGGMGEIYKGHLVETGDPVAIKMMLPELCGQKMPLRFLVRRHRHYTTFNIDLIARYYVFTVEPVLRRPYLAMEFVDGITLTDHFGKTAPWLSKRFRPFCAVSLRVCRSPTSTGSCTAISLPTI